MGGSRNIAGFLICSLPLSLPILGLWGAHRPDGLGWLTCSFCPPDPPWTAHPHASHPSLPAACQEGLKNISCSQAWLCAKRGCCAAYGLRPKTEWSPLLRATKMYLEGSHERSAGLTINPRCGSGTLTHICLSCVGSGASSLPYVLGLTLCIDCLSVKSDFRSPICYWLCASISQ